MILPQLVHDTGSAFVCLVVGTFFTVSLYQFTNRIHRVEPKLLPFDMVDRTMPFWPKTVWIYFTEYVIFFACYFLLESWLDLARYFYSYMTILFISCIVFWIYPVTFPREKYHLRDYPDNLSKRALSFLRDKMDTPANCLPSLHVSSCFVSAFAFWYQSKILFSIFFVWSVLVGISTMTTKQHYFIDVWTAFLLTVLVFWFYYFQVSFV